MRKFIVGNWKMNGTRASLNEAGAMVAEFDWPLRRTVDQALACSATGGPDSVRRDLLALIARYEPDEVIFTARAAEGRPAANHQ